MTNVKTIDLNQKVDEILQYRVNLLNPESIEDYEECATFFSRFIEKAAGWYEYMYPNCQLNGALPDEDTPTFQDFLDMCDENEKTLVEEPEWPSMFFSDVLQAFISLDKNGCVTSINACNEYRHLEFYKQRMCNKPIQEGMENVRRDSIWNSAGKDFEEVINEHQMWETERKSIFYAIMYRILERGGSKFGPIRAMTFAQEFDLDTKIPLAYSIDEQNMQMKKMIEAYLGENKDRIFPCYVNYFNADDKENVQSIDFHDVETAYNLTEIANIPDEKTAKFITDNASLLHDCKISHKTAELMRSRRK